MTNDSEEELVCPECGGLTQVLREGLTLGLSCTRCTWSVVSTCIPEIQLDYTSYEVRVGGGDYRNRPQIKLVADISGVNFLEARKLLQQTEPLIFSGRAVDVVPVREALNRAGLVCTITPEFRW